jgi:AcrR family transcriptional regulator
MADSSARPRRPEIQGTPSLEPVRDRLLASASRLFYSDGIRAVGIDRILEDAGAAKASLYAHFASKDELVAAYLEAHAELARESLRASLRCAGTDPRARLLALFDGSIAMAAQDGFRGCPFQIAAAEITDSGHPGSRVIRLQLDWVRNLITSLVREKLPDAPPELATAICTLYNGALTQASMCAAGDALVGARWAVEQLIPQA